MTALATTHTEISPTHNLLALAAERSSEKRLELLRRISDTFSVQNESSTVQYLLGEIVSKLLENFERGDRASAASILSRMPSLPEETANALAYDADFAVAQPIIRDYRGLRDKVLVDLASTGSQAHLEAIAGRHTLAPDITDILTERGNDETVRTLAANQGARFSRLGMRKMIDKSEHDAMLQELLVNRSDLSLEAVGQLLPIVSQILASKLRSSDLTFSPAVVQEQVTNWVSDRKKHIGQVHRYIQQIRDGSEKLDNVLMVLVMERRLLDVATVIASSLDLDHDYGFNLVTQGRTDNVMVLLRALNVASTAALGVLRLRSDKLGQQLCGPPVDQATYESVDVAGAQRVIRFLKVRRLAMAQEQAAQAS
jgi:hypothetical protein